MNCSVRNSYRSPNLRSVDSHHYQLLLRLKNHIEMIRCAALVIFLVVAQGKALTFSRNGQYIPNIKIAEEIDISDVTFTTPATDSVRVASVTKSKVNQRNKPRIIVPVVTYHKGVRPPSELAGNSLNLYKNLKPRKFKYIPLTRSVNDVFGQGVTSKILLVPNYRKYNTPAKSNRPVYYLVGDDATTNGGYDSEMTMNGKTAETVKLYNERELQFVKPNKYPSPSLKKFNHNNKPDGDEDEIESDDNTQTFGHHAGDMPTTKGDRVEFQMYGMDGPNSYKFGYDTGKGDNRHFRFEERDSDGKIRGHYGYMDNEGKMRIMKYEADPEKGFHAGPVDYSEDESS